MFMSFLRWASGCRCNCGGCKGAKAGVRGAKHCKRKQNGCNA